VRGNNNETEPAVERSPVVPADDAIGVSSAAMRETLSRFATGVTIVTAATEFGPAGFTCQSFSALSLEPPLVLLCPAKTSTSWRKIAGAKRFSVSVLGKDHEDLCRDFAVSGGNKFAERSWEVSERTEAPIISGAVAVIDCQIEEEHDTGDHTVVIARVLGLSHGETEPLLFFRRQFRQLSNAAALS
jgi:3-hydroxy-9,10-secoandrosta-1,3,5(10)-triene-9,17-dione monooxygenase reductase component